MKRIALLTSALLVFCVLVGGVALMRQGGGTPKSDVGREHNATLLSPNFFDEAYEQAAALSNEVPLAPETRGGIVPHHLLAAPLIAQFFEQLAALKPTRVIIVGPDHLGRAHAGAITTDGSWKTPYGVLRADVAAVRQLQAAGVAVLEPSVFDVEHSIAALVPFMQRSLPKATIVPILVNSRITADEADALADILPHDEHTIILASVDFSHYLPGRVAQFHDVMSMAALQSFSFEELDDLEVDSPESLRVFLKAMEAAGAPRMTLHANTNSAALTGEKALPETTSYVIASFAESGSKTSPIRVEGSKRSVSKAFDIVPPSTLDTGAFDTVTLLAFGDMMLDRSVRLWMKKEGNAYPFARIRGAEDRFFRGVDIITGNLEGAIGARREPVKSIDFAFDPAIADTLRTLNVDVVSTANNHALDQGRAGAAETASVLDRSGVGHVGDQVRDDTAPWVTTVRGKRVAMFAYNVTDNILEVADAEPIVRQAAAENDAVVVFVHWGAEYQPRPTGDQRALGRLFVDWGADAVIGSHPHVMQGMEVYKDRPIFWSLGNFIFDQYFSEETQRGLAVGLAFEKDRITAYLFPIVSEDSQPFLAVGAEDQRLLDRFVDRSDLSTALQAEARSGILHVDLGK